MCQSQRGNDLEPEDVFVGEGSGEQQQRQALHLRHGSKALQLSYHVPPKSLQGTVAVGVERQHVEIFMP